MEKHWTSPYLLRNWNAKDFNCWTLVAKVYKYQLGIELDLHNGSNLENISELPGVFKSELSSWVPSPSVGKFDVVAMGSGNKIIHHVGVMIARGRVLHINKNTMGRIDSILSLRNQFKTIKFYHHASCCHSKRHF